MFTDAVSSIHNHFFVGDRRRRRRCARRALGLGGAEFRLPVLVGYFRYRLLRAISLNTAVSLLTVLAAATTRVLLAGQGPDLALAPVALAMMIGGMAGAALAAR